MLSRLNDFYLFWLEVRSPKSEVSSCLAHVFTLPSSDFQLSYSYFKESTGFFLAAFKACVLTVATAMRRAIDAASK
jgi:hypothetical protein